MKWWFVLLLGGVLLVSGCTRPPATPIDCGQTPKDLAIEECKEICMSISSDLTNRSPCLSDSNPQWNVAGWVCDVAHSPRIAIDDLPQNQCLAFREGRANHFVEVSPSCEFIRAV